MGRSDNGEDDGREDGGKGSPVVVELDGEGAAAGVGGDDVVLCAWSTKLRIKRWDG